MTSALPPSSPKSESNRGQPSAADARDQLERILGSPAFAASAQRRALFRFLVEEALAGRADRLKGSPLPLPSSAAQRPSALNPIAVIADGFLRIRVAEHVGDILTPGVVAASRHGQAFSKRKVVWPTDSDPRADQAAQPSLHREAMDRLSRIA